MVHEVIVSFAKNSVRINLTTTSSPEKESAETESSNKILDISEKELEELNEGNFNFNSHIKFGRLPYTQ